MKSIALLAAVAAQPGLPTWAFIALCIVAVALALGLIVIRSTAQIAAEEEARMAGSDGDELGGSHEHTPVDPILDPRRTTRL